jgi:rhodanese-related sulfurtransferase
MKIILPAREAVGAHGWTHQVQWEEDRKPCFVRCKTGRQADAYADQLKRAGLKPVVIDLHDAMQLH